jgi:hypothetical protein
MKKIIYSLMALCALATGTVQASINTLDGYLSVSTQEDYFSFHVDAAGSVNLYTSSLSPFDPFLTLWSASSSTPTTADLTLLGSNDNTASWSSFESGSNAKDAQIKLNLAIGDYFARVTSSSADAFAYQFNVDTDNLTGTLVNSTGASISNVAAVAAPAAVPAPAAVWLFGTGLLTFLGVAKRKGQQSVMA